MVTNPRTATLAPVRALVNDGPFFGCDGNREQWRQEAWPTGVVPMREARTGSATLNIFDRSALNPADGQWGSAAPDEVSIFLHDNPSQSSATMVNRRIDRLTGDALEETAGLGAGEIRVVREEAA